MAGDATGVATRRYQRWFDVRHGKKGRRRSFVKRHAIVATRAEGPFFLSARVTRGTRNDSPELGPLLDQLDPSIELGNGAFDRGYPSRRNAQLIEDRGGFPVIDRKKIATAKALGHPAWRQMVHRQRSDRRAFRCRYRRRPVVEGVFGGFKRRFGEVVRARRRHAQRIEILCRVVVWNLLGMVYHGRKVNGYELGYRRGRGAEGVQLVTATITKASTPAYGPVSTVASSSSRSGRASQVTSSLRAQVVYAG